ncbi:hypothetical protein [Conexivisphaera calida]|uniref:Uncharacterized protein n=1 Tax=Conexivisphaera calida TaxID=1874277 RepID=A0A4P2VEY4_9ARCH|nr:hypothetical protein [Conexivisphaera calida]BBE42023.1 hypothetical protein NAS2_0634 [Conexivisphaera calida]
MKDVPRDLIRRMEREEVTFPGEFVDVMAERRPLGLRRLSARGFRACIS